MAKTAIEWAEFSWNPIRARIPRAAFEVAKVGWYCEHVSEGCRNCYAESFNKRMGTGFPYKPGFFNRVDIIIDEQCLAQPMKWKRKKRVFVCSMSDLFGVWVTNAMIDRIFATMAICQQHTFQVLTKRPDRMLDYMASPDAEARVKLLAFEAMCEAQNIDVPPPTWPLPNVWLGVSAEDQETANERIALLVKTPARVRWVSAEPLLGPIDLEASGAVTRQTPGAEPAGCIDWLVAGGESGRSARPMHPDWARSLRDQCKAAGIDFFMKQMGGARKRSAIEDFPVHLQVREYPGKVGDAVNT